MSSEMRKKVLAALSDEPQTPFDISKVIHHDQKTVQMILLEELNSDKTIGFKKIGRYRMFWRRAPVKVRKP